VVIEELLPVMRRGDLRGFQRLLNQLHREGRRLSPDQLTEAIGEIEPVLPARYVTTTPNRVGTSVPLRRREPASSLPVQSRRYTGDRRPDHYPPAVKR
jgi:hypothetical protein